MVAEQDKHPNYKILANGTDITDKIKPYIKSISLTDNDKDESDELTLSLSAKFQRPNYADELKVFLGWQGEELKFAGKFYVQKSSIRNNKELTISATGVNLKDDLKERRNETHERSLESLIQQLSKQNNLLSKVDIDDISGVFEQKNESDMAFMNRLAKENNATFNIKNDTVYFVKEEVENVVPSFSIDLDKCYDSDITYSNQSHYKSCVAKYHDTKTNKMVEGKSGDGSPSYVVEGKFLNAEEAQRAAESGLKRANQAQIEGTLTMQGEVVFAGSLLNIINENQQCNISRVTHTIESGWKTGLEFKSVASGEK